MTAPHACPQPERLSRLLASGLNEDEQRELTAHLDRCPRCRQELERLASGEEAWAETARKLGAACAAPEPRLQEVLADLQDKGLGDRTQAEPKSATEDTLAFLSPPSEAGHLGRLGHYEVIEVVGRGGMGVVLKAFDTHLHRIVAVKVMAEALASSASARQRFLREARAAAAVRNDHVIDIHHVGEENGLPYLVMEYIAGRSLQERLDQTGPLQLKEILRIGMQTAAGLAAAHAQGLIHRDIKPANILLENGVERVKITDFGLARAVDDASLTQSGVVTGTPQYMAPEQARGEAVDHRADLFSLGSVLYAMCAGRPPFRAGTTMGVLRLVSDAVPRPIREVNPDVSERLAVIVAKLHAKEPGERFQSAAEVAEALSQHLAELQQPDSDRLAPRVGTQPRSDGATRKSRHRWAVAAVVALLLAGLGMTEATGVTQVLPTVIRIARGDGTLMVEVDGPEIQVTVEGDGEELIFRCAGFQEIRLRPGKYKIRTCGVGRPVSSVEAFTIFRGGKCLVRVTNETADRVATATPFAGPLAIEAEPLPDLPPGAPLNDMTLVNRPAHIDRVRSWTVETVGHRSGVEGLVYSPDGRLLATGERGGIIRLWEADTGRLVRTIVTPSSWLTSLTWSADGKVLASACQEEAVRFWDVSSGRLLRTLHLPSVLHVMAWAPNGRTLATCGWDHRIRLWDVRTGRLLDVLQTHQGHVRALAFSPDSQTLASGSLDRTARLWDAGSGQHLHTLTGHEGEVKGLAWSPDGKRLASASYDRTVRVWDVVSRDCLRILKGHKDEVYVVAWSPDGKRLASGSVDRIVRVWDPRSGEKLHTLEGHEHLISALAWSPDGAALASASWDSTVRLWRTDTGQPQRILPGLPAWAFNHARWSPDGRMLATGAETARLWEVSTGFMSRALPTEAGIVRGWSPDSKTVFTTQWDHRVGLWDAGTGQPRRRLSGHTGPVHAVACSPDGKRIASASEDHTLRLWDTATGQLLDTFHDQAEERILTIAWSLDGNGLICGGPTNKSARIWDIVANKLAQTQRKLVTGPLRTLALSPDGKTLASGGDDQVVQLWDASSCQFRRTLAKHSGMVYAVAWAPDGKTLASAGGWGEVRLWEPGTGSLLRTLKGPATPLIAVTWSADGRSVAASGEGPSLWIWDTATGRQTAVLLGLPDNRFLTVSENGHYRCSVGGEQQLRYVVQTSKGQETLTTEEFTHKYSWKNDPNRVWPTSPER